MIEFVKSFYMSQHVDLNNSNPIKFCTLLNLYMHAFSILYIEDFGNHNQDKHIYNN
jgi:hypothetical protein